MISIYFYGCWNASFRSFFCHALTTVATGGFSTNNNSIAHYNNTLIELTIVLGMIIASLPFTLYLSSLHKGLIAFKDTQVTIFLLLICFFTLSLTIWNYLENNITFFYFFKISLI